MIDYSTALEIILDHARPLSGISRPLGTCLGRVLAEDVYAREDIPLFDASAVDGYALRATEVATATIDKPAYLNVTDEIQAGDTSARKLRRGSMRILTGAPVPSGADAIVMKEDILLNAERITIRKPVSKGENIRYHGQEFRKGTLVLSAGTKITPPVVGLLATLGSSRVKVYRTPRVAMIITGNELRSPSSTLKRGQIRDSNSFMLGAALTAEGIEPVVLHARDTKRATMDSIREALRISDLVISVGGVSVGDYDYVKEACAGLGIVERFWRVAIKPGKPVYFGTKGRKLFFGLPGNPVAALLTCSLFVQSALHALQGGNVHRRMRIPAVLESDVKKKAGRMEFVRVCLENDEHGMVHAVPTRGQDSHMLGGIATADAFIRFHRDAERLTKGTLVEVELLPWRR